MEGLAPFMTLKDSVELAWYRGKSLLIADQGSEWRKKIVEKGFIHLILHLILCKHGEKF